MRAATLTGPIASSPLDVSRLPLSRAAAVQSWSRALWTTALAQIAVLSIHGAFQVRPVIPGDARIDPTVHALMGALFLPFALVALVRRAEKRLLRRPPKGLLVWQAALFIFGSLLATFETLSTTGFEVSMPLFWAGHGILALSILLPAVWFTGAFIASSGEIPEG